MLSVSRGCEVSALCFPACRLSSLQDLHCSLQLQLPRDFRSPAQQLWVDCTSSTDGPVTQTFSVII